MAEMTQDQFEVVAELLRAQEPVKSAVHMVLVGGNEAKAAAEAFGLVHQSVTNSLRRYRNAHKKLQKAYQNA